MEKNSFPDSLSSRRRPGLADRPSLTSGGEQGRAKSPRRRASQALALYPGEFNRRISVGGLLPTSLEAQNSADQEYPCYDPPHLREHHRLHRTAAQGSGQKLPIAESCRGA